MLSPKVRTIIIAGVMAGGWVAVAPATHARHVDSTYQPASQQLLAVPHTAEVDTEDPWFVFCLTTQPPQKLDDCLNGLPSKDGDYELTLYRWADAAGDSGLDDPWFKFCLKTSTPEQLDDCLNGLPSSDSGLDDPWFKFCLKTSTPEQLDDCLNGLAANPTARPAQFEIQVATSDLQNAESVRGRR